MNRAQPPRGSPLGIPPWLVPRSFLCKQKCSSTLAWAKHRLGQTQRACSELGKEAGDSAPKRSSWAKAWRMREAPIRELMEAEIDVA